MGRLARYLVAICVLVIVGGQAAEVDAKSKRSSDFTKTGKYASLVVDAESGDVIYSRNANKIRYPASLTKMMTLYLTFQALEEGKLYYYQKIPVSKKASLQPRTKLWLKKGQTITVRDAIMSLIVRSANDAAVVLAEAIDGTEAKFANHMTKTARQLGMSNTTFKNASGLPNKYQKTSAYDMAKLGIALKRDFPKYFPLFSKTSFKFRGKIITSHNRVLTRYKWADGLKTGYTNASGYNLVTSTSHPNSKLVGVVMGGPSSAVRDNHMIQILDYSYKLANKSKLKQQARIQKLKANNPTIFRFIDKHKNKDKVLMTRDEKNFHSKHAGGVFEAVGISKLIKDSPEVFSINNAFDYADKVTEDSEEMEFSGADDEPETTKVKEQPKPRKKVKLPADSKKKTAAKSKAKPKKKKPQKVTKVTPKPKTKVAKKSKSKKAKS